MDKQTVIREARAFFENKIASTRQSLANTRQMAAEAPGRISSRYDTSREETSWLADGQHSVLSAWQRSLAALAVLPSRPCDRFQTGSLCQLRDTYQQTRMLCLVCPGGAGFDCEIDGHKVLLLSPASPLARAAAGKGSGCIVKLNSTTTYVIEEIW